MSRNRHSLPCILASVAILTAFQEDAKACSPSPELVQVAWPENGALDVPTNTAFFFVAQAEQGRQIEFALQGTTGATVALTALGDWSEGNFGEMPLPSLDPFRVLAFTSSSALRPESDYELTSRVVDNGATSWQAQFHFRTGTGPRLEPQPAITQIRLFYHRKLDGAIVFDTCSYARVDEVTEAYLSLSASSMWSLIVAEGSYPRDASYRDSPKAGFAMPSNQARLIRHGLFGRSSGPICGAFQIVDGVGRVIRASACDIELCAEGLEPSNWNLEQWMSGGTADCSGVIPRATPDGGAMLDAAIDGGSIVDSGGATDVGSEVLDGGGSDAGLLGNDSGCGCSTTSTHPRPFGLGAMALLGFLVFGLRRPGR